MNLDEIFAMEGGNVPCECTECLGRVMGKRIDTALTSASTTLPPLRMAMPTHGATQTPPPTAATLTAAMLMTVATPTRQSLARGCQRRPTTTPPT